MQSVPSVEGICLLKIQYNYNATACLFQLVIRCRFCRFLFWCTLPFHTKTMFGSSLSPVVYMICAICVCLHDLCYMCLFTMKTTNTWEANGMMNTHAYCTFKITERQRPGVWKMTINTNISTDSSRFLFWCTLPFHTKTMFGSSLSPVVYMICAICVCLHDLCYMCLFTWFVLYVFVYMICVICV
jgi:phosphomevalonate kinase